MGANKRRVVYIFDNAPYHVSKSTEQMVLSSGIFALTLPTYFPEFNPCELAINFIKTKVDKLKKNG